jgi:large subunit ribosomal protein L21
MKYAVIAIQGKQYRVEEGQELIVDRLEGKKGDAVKISDVLLFSDGKKILVGSPLVKDITIKATLSDHQSGDKIRVATFKAKSRERKTHGHRQAESVIKIESIAAA